ncbi:MAG: hypothetical protein AB1498_11610 [bacterium]
MKNQNPEIWYYAAAAVIIIIIISLFDIQSKKELTEKSYDSTIEKIIIESKSGTEINTGIKPEGRIVPPASQYEISLLRQKLNLPEEEAKDTRQAHEEVLKKDPQAKFIF